MVALLASGLAITVLLIIASAGLSILAAVPLGSVMETPGRRRLDKAAVRTFVAVFRGTSVLVQLFYFYYVLPEFGVWLSPIMTAIAVLALNTAAYGIVIIASAIRSVPAGQREAAIALGLRPWRIYFKVILPQALAVAIPSYTNLVVDLMKATPLVAFITVRDASFEAKSLYQTYGHPLALYSFLLVAYLCIGQTILAGGRRLQRSLGVWAVRR